VERIAGSEGLRVQPAKTRIRRGFQRQEVTGIVVNDHPNLLRADYDRLRAVLHNAARHGPAGQNRDGHADFRAHLLGRIAWATQLNPGRGQRLAAAFDAIEWPIE
jgi:RNA-directed DNA polymerase